MILQRIFEEKTEGFYVDVGAHHPMRYSNTYLFYKKGWRGINIDAMPRSMVPFLQDRPRDINLEIAIAGRSGEPLTFHVFNEPALNTFDEALAMSRVGGPHERKIVRKVPMRTQRLEEVLKAHLTPNTRIDFMTVDVEGLDLEVLRSNDWTRFRPCYVLAECFNILLGELAGNEVASFLDAQGYVPYAKTVHTVIFKDVSR